MAPADPKDWLFAATALTAVATSSASANDAPQAGVVTGAVASTSQNLGAATNAQSVVLGNIVRSGEQFRTGPEGVIHILFLDQSSVTLGPNSQMTLDSFSHNAEARSGKIVMTLHDGSLRVVGGINSKTEATEIRTAAGTVAILGGISVVQSQGQTTSASFLFGTTMTVSSGGQAQTVTRPGFSSSMSGGQPPTPPERTQPNQLSAILGRFESPVGSPSSGGLAPNALSTSAASTGGTPTPTLIATSDRPGGQSSVQSTLAVDRLSNPNSALVGRDMSQSRNDSTGSGEAQAPITTVRTPQLPGAVS